MCASIYATLERLLIFPTLGTLVSGEDAICASPTKRNGGPQSRSGAAAPLQ
jgi:hypothetical protein